MRRMEASSEEVDWPVGTRAQKRSWWTASTVRGPDPSLYTRLGLPLSVSRAPRFIVQLTVCRAIFCLTFHLPLEAQTRAAKVISWASRFHRTFAQLVGLRLHRDAEGCHDLRGLLMLASLRLVERPLAGGHRTVHQKGVRCRFDGPGLPI